TSDTSGANLNDVDLESILRQRALENLRKFRGQVQSAAKASEQKNKIVSQVKQPVSDKEELVQDKPNISDVAIATKSGKQTLVEETSLPVGRRNLVASPRNSGRNLNADKNISGSAKIQIACAPEKVIDADNQSKVVTESTNTITGNLDSTPSESCHDSLQSRSSLKRTTVSGLPHEKLVLAESIKNKGSNDNVKDIRGMPSAGGKPSIAGTTSSIDGPTFKHNNLDKGQDGASDHSQFQSKQTSDLREPSYAKLPVSEADEERNVAKTAQSSIQIINSSGREVDGSHDAATLESGFKSSSVENISGKAQDESNQGSQFEQKTMTVMRGGELVQVSYKVYIPKKTPALARRQLKR
ncbi:peptidyl-prolyl cis-trans isomerase g-like protein, partial [Trifolium pratense]